MSNNVDFFVKKFQALSDREPDLARYYSPRPYRNAVVRFRHCRVKTCEERRQIVEANHLNVFFFPSCEIPGCDLLSDSGTTTMTTEQWSCLLLGDEAYGSNEGYFELKDQIVRTFGDSWKQEKQAENMFLFHQGRAAENAFFTVFSRMLAKGKPNDTLSLSNHLDPVLKERIEMKIDSAGKSGEQQFIIPSNSHFDTTEANIENNRMIPLNLRCDEDINKEETYPFRGNMNTRELRNLLENERDRVPLIYLTITNNTGGGQPVSMANIREVKQMSDEFDIPFFIDACRFAENGWFIKQREEGFQDKSIQEIVHEMFACADGFHISFKKDGLVNIGGGLAVKEDGRMLHKFPQLQSSLTDYQILTEGHPTYGGMAGRDLKALAEGLRTVVHMDYLDSRIGQVKRFGDRLKEFHIPVVTPIGGHAVYIDMDEFLGRYRTPDGDFKYETNTRDEDFKGISLSALLLIAGHRFCELGLYVFGKNRNGKEIPPDPRANLVRAAIPRLAYEDQDLLAAAEAVKVLYDHRDRIPLWRSFTEMKNSR